MSHDSDDHADWESLIQLELSTDRTKRFVPDPEVFSDRARAAVLEAKYANARRVLSIFLNGLMPEPPNEPTAASANSRVTRVNRVMHELFGDKAKPGRPEHDLDRMLFGLAEAVLLQEHNTPRRRPSRRASAGGRLFTLGELAADVVERVTGEPNVALAKTLADRFSRDRDDILADYRNENFGNGERLIAGVMIDLMAACDLDTDPTVATLLSRAPGTRAAPTAEELEDTWEQRLEAMARRDE